MSISTLGDIITKVRRLTGSGTSLQLTDSQIIDYINSFYLYDFPAQFRSLKLKDIYTFNTVPGIDVYPFDYNHWSTVQAPCYVMKRPLKLFTNKNGFYTSIMNWQFQQNFPFASPFSGILTAHPIIRSANNNPMVTTPLSSTLPFPTGIPVPFPQSNISRVQNLLITVNTVSGSFVVTDDGNGNLIGDCQPTATIDYSTGQISNLIFTTPADAIGNIQVQYSPSKQTVPINLLFLQNQFTLRPVPDRSYTIEVTAYRLPSQVLLGSMDPDNPDLQGVPELLEWFETLAYGAAKKVYEDRLDDDGIALMKMGLEERFNLNEVRTYAQLGSMSIDTIFRDQLTNNYGSYGLTFGNPGP